MKVIDLLSKLANYEGVPKYFMIDGVEYYVNNDGQIQERNGKEVEWFIYRSWLNEEVEIIEEDKKIEKIDYDIEEDKFSTYINGRFEWVDIPKKDRELYDFYKNKINELTDEINKLKGVK